MAVADLVGLDCIIVRVCRAMLYQRQMNYAVSCRLSLYQCTATVAQRDPRYLLLLYCLHGPTHNQVMPISRTARVALLSQVIKNT